MYDVHIEVESLVYIYVYVGSRTIFFPVIYMLYVGQKLYIAYVKMLFLYTDNKEIFDWQ